MSATLPRGLAGVPRPARGSGGCRGKDPAARDVCGNDHKGRLTNHV
jgi:hypothetical protein